MKSTFKTLLTLRFILACLSVGYITATLSPLLQTQTGRLLLLILSALAFLNIAKRKPAGWLFLAAYLFSNCFLTEEGLPALILLTISITSLLVYGYWTAHPLPLKSTSELTSTPNC